MSNFIPTALVTGGSRGIGRAVAKKLATDGYQVYITYNSKADEAKNVIDEICSVQGMAVAFPLNIADSQSVVNFFTKKIKDKVLLSVLVNNAGITKDTYLIRMKDEDFDAVLNTNLRGAFLCLREAAKIMSKQKQGKIINISSVVGQMGNACQANYSAAKAGLIGLTKSCAKELAVRNITVNTVAPGFIKTDMTKALPEEVIASYKAAIPLARLGTVEDVANAVSFLASDNANYITGQILAVNGGLYC